MYQPQQSSLPGAYYGPSIPPQPYQRPRRRNCTVCLFSTLIKSIIAFCLAVGITILILWLVFHPNKIKVTVENASLTRFNITDTNVLHFDLATNITLRNPNKKIGIYYDWLEAGAYYDGVRFGWIPLTSFYQHHKNTTVLTPAFGGQSLFLNRDYSNFANFQQDNATGQFFNVDVWLHSRVRFKFGSFTTRRYMARVKCELALRLITNETTDNEFTRTRCDVVDF